MTKSSIFVKKKHSATHPELTQPVFGELRTTSGSLVPYNVEIGWRGEILRDGYCLIEVQDDMPPATRYEYGFAWLLKDLKLKTLQ